MGKIRINDNYYTEGFTKDNIEGFTTDERKKMNDELFDRLKSNDLDGMPDYERENAISRDILNRY